MMKRILRLTAFLLGSTLLLSACGNTKGKEMVDASTQTAPPVEGVTALALCDGDVTLRFEKDESGAWTWFDDPAFPLDQTALEDLLALPAAWTAAKRWPMCRSWPSMAWRLPRSTSPSPPTAWTSSIISATRPRMAVGTCSPLPVRCAIPLTKIRCCSAAASTPMAVLPVLPVIEPDRLVSVSLLRADGTAAVSFYTAEDGTRRSANRDVTEKTAALADEIAALTLTACVDYDPAEGAAAVCGLDTPEVTLTVNYLADNSAERTLILAVGLSTGDGGRYVALDGDTTIYRMEESSLTQILDPVRDRAVSHKKGGAAMRILIVEDEKRLAGTLQDLLRRQGYTADVCYDGISGLDNARSDIYDLLVLDAMLPGMDGFALLRQLRGGGSPPAVLMLTARSELNDRVRGLDAGADYYLTKPFEPEELLACIRSLLRRGG